ncbi:hypothetical protein FACS1894159_06800 [Bacteroidia bacterium]|nr:hypothetical protein FACS1894159_06800 [Bacteroidia bacterium]
MNKQAEIVNAGFDHLAQYLHFQTLKSVIRIDSNAGANRLIVNKQAEIVNAGFDHLAQYLHYQTLKSVIRIDSNAGANTF